MNNPNNNQRRCKQIYIFWMEAYPSMIGFEDVVFEPVADCRSKPTVRTAFSQALSGCVAKAA